MRVADLATRRVAIWGLGREGRAAIGFLRKFHPDLPLAVLNDDPQTQPPEGLGESIEWAFGAEQIAHALETVEVIVKSPGVSLYRPEIRCAQQRGVRITSLLNLWVAEQPAVTTICVTGTKGKSTTASLIAFMLDRLGRRVALAGNIGVPITEIDLGAADYAVVEMSSYQAADFEGNCDAALLTSLYPEHVDWHGSVEIYFRDKINLIAHGRSRIVNGDALESVNRWLRAPPARTYLFNSAAGIHSRGSQILDEGVPLGAVADPYLARAHNRSNLCGALSAVKAIGLDPRAALDAASGFRGLPHRQQELGEIEGVLFVDDSISTIPESTLAALSVYTGRDVAVIVGGYDRGIDYSELVATGTRGAAKAMICIGDSGKRIYALGRAAPHRGKAGCTLLQAASMGDAVALARSIISPGGVVLLSPAAPSYGVYRDYIERGRDFAAHAGFPTAI